MGVALVRWTPAELKGMARFVDLIGYMTLTNNGGIEDIKALPSARVHDLSMTPRALEPHCDNPYRVPQPGYTLLHCIRHDAQGGESAWIASADATLAGKLGCARRGSRASHRDEARQQGERLQPGPDHPALATAGKQAG